FALEKLVGTSLLQQLHSTGRKNEDLFYCVYNYLLNGTAWIDSLKSSYDSIDLANFFSWHFNRLAKQNPFVVLELTQNESPEDSKILPLYRRFFSEVKAVQPGSSIQNWIDLEMSFITSCVERLQRAQERQALVHELEAKNKWVKKYLNDVYKELFQAFENHQSQKLLEKLQPIIDVQSLPAEVALLKNWAELKQRGAEYSALRLKELACEIQRLPVPLKFNYLLRVNQALIKKLLGDMYSTRRLLNESHRLAPQSLNVQRELRTLNRPENKIYASLVKWSDKLRTSFL
ncbi:MAG: hypothetical protein KDD40_05775, partial [Bdellovibrionales bacterium]|nr:hypothetical protein [Bdellovibrionales bacterium]